MSGHSKWSTIKHKKAAADAKRGKLFTRLIRELTIAAKEGGGDPDGNPRLRTAIAGAKAANMPADNMKRAIQKGTGELPGVEYEEVVYEGYGVGGVAIIIECLTDNRMRTTPEIRHLFSKHDGNLGEPNSVAWMFDRKGLLRVAPDATDEESLMELALDAGAEDLQHDDDGFSVYTTAESFHAVQQALDTAGVPTVEASLVREPQNTIELDGDKARACLRLLDALEEHDDVQNVFANLEVSDDDLASGAA